MCGGFVGKIFDSVLSPIFGSRKEETQMQPKTLAAPTVLDSGQAELDAAQQKKKKAGLNAGYNNNILAGGSTSGNTGKKSLLGE